MLLVVYSSFGQTGIIAHRGYWDTEGSAQNSITSLKKAAEAGVYGSEFDVIITKDGTPVVNHDDDIEGFVIEDTDYKTIKNMQLKNGEQLPTLEKYLKQGKKLKNIQLILEIKPHKQKENEAKAVKIITDMVKKWKMEKQVEYISFSWYVCTELHRLSPSAPVAYIEGDLCPAELKEAGLSGLDYNYKTLLEKPEWIQEAHQLGLTVNVWTVNDSELMKKFMDWGVDFITTDKPVELKKLIYAQSLQGKLSKEQP